jgi:hypothetical protein
VHADDATHRDYGTPDCRYVALGRSVLYWAIFEAVKRVPECVQMTKYNRLFVKELIPFVLITRKRKFERPEGKKIMMSYVKAYNDGLWK